MAGTPGSSRSTKNAVRCADVVASVAVGFGPEAESTGIELVTHVQPENGLWVDVDPDRLGQVLANLVENAFKFARSKVVIGAGIAGPQTVIWVGDDGPGIAAEDLPHVFERHFSSDRVPSRKLGTGLGLAIVAELTQFVMGSKMYRRVPCRRRPGHSHDGVARARSAARDRRKWHSER